MRVIETKVYSLSELSPEAKARALDKCRDWNVQDMCWYEDVFDQAKALGAMLGIDIDNIYFSGFWHQGDGAQFTGSYAYKKDSTSAIRAECPIDTKLQAIAARLYDIQKHNAYSLTAEVYNAGRYAHEMATTIDVDRTDNKSVSEETSEDLVDILRDFMRWIYRALELEYEYLTSDSVVAESLEANEIEFTEDGCRA